MKIICILLRKRDDITWTKISCSISLPIRDTKIRADNNIGISNFFFIIAACIIIMIMCDMFQRITTNGINCLFGAIVRPADKSATQFDSRNDLEATMTPRRRGILACPDRSYLDSILGIPGGFFCFCSERNRGSLACGGTQMTKVHARYALARSAQVRRTLARS